MCCVLCVCVCVVCVSFLADNLPLALCHFGVTGGSRLKADDFLQNYQLVLSIHHWYCFILPHMHPRASDILAYICTEPVEHLNAHRMTHDAHTSTDVLCHLHSSDPLPDGAEFEVVGDVPQLEEAKEAPTTAGVKRRHGICDLEDGTEVEVSQSKRVRRSIDEDEHRIKNALD